VRERLLDTAALTRLIPHRHPLLMLDYVASYEPGKSLTAIKAVGIAEPCFAGHFPGLPIFPGALLIEALAQACAVFSRLDALGWRPGDALIVESMGDEVGVLGTSRMRFNRPTLPGTLLTLRIQQERAAERKVFFDVRAAGDDGETRAEGALVVATVEMHRLRGAASAAP
jgi:3-hydroxyacyl-[acyl-carrier-protein] dehydratase